MAGTHIDFVWPPPEGEGMAEELVAETRPWLGIQFECCDVYTRVYREPTDTEYVGRCPKCLRQVRVKVGPGGVSAKLFRAKVV